MKIENIPTESWGRIVKTLLERGWQNAYALEGVAGSVDYQEVHLKKDTTLVKFVWDNWSEGEIMADEEVAEVRDLL